MKRIVHFVAIFSISSVWSQSQLPNGGFESWSDGKPVNTYYFSHQDALQQSSDRTEGSWAAQLIDMKLAGSNLPAQPNLTYHSTFHDKPDSISFEFKYLPTNWGNYFSILATLKMYNSDSSDTETISFGYYQNAKTVESYKKVVLALSEFQDMKDSIPDYIRILINPSNSPHLDSLGTELYIDNFQLIYNSPNAVKENELEVFRVFPNPVENYLTIAPLDKMPSMDKKTYRICNSLGQNVVSGELHNSASKTLDVSSLQKGYYFITFEASEPIKAVSFIKK